MTILQTICERFGIGAYPQLSRYPTQAEQIAGWMKPEELTFLRLVAAQVDNFAEIGSWKGRSTFAIAKACHGPVWAIDHWESDEAFADFKRNVGNFQNVIPLRMKSAQAASICPDIDAVFIDGSHDYETCRLDLSLWKSKAKKIICGHDFNWPGVKRAVSDELGEINRGPGVIWWKSTEAN